MLPVPHPFLVIAKNAKKELVVGCTPVEPRGIYKHPQLEELQMHHFTLKDLLAFLRGATPHGVFTLEGSCSKCAGKRGTTYLNLP